MTRGRWFVAGAVGLALAAAIGNLAYQHSRFRRAREFWGGPMALAIGQEPRVELLVLEPGGAAVEDATTEALALGRGKWRIASRHEISQAAGLSQLRRSLLDSHSFAWGETAPRETPAWRYALRFGDDDATTLGVTADGTWITTSEGVVVSSAPRAKALVTFLSKALE